MFDYLDVDEDARQALTLRRRPPRAGRVVRHLAYDTSIVMDLPRDQGELRQRRSRSYWATQRRNTRGFERDVGPLTFRVLTEADELRAVLPAVREMFLERWDGDYTTLPWRDPERFEPYADAIVRMAADGRASLAVLEGDGRLLAYDWGILSPPWYHAWQHATTTCEAYRKFGVGTLLLTRLIRDLVDRPEIDHLDLMIGDQGYKLHWETSRRPVYLRLQESDTPVGRARLAARTGYHRSRLRVQDDPRLRQAAKRALYRVDSLRLALRTSASHRESF